MSNAAINVHIALGEPCGSGATLEEIADWAGQLIQDDLDNRFPLGNLVPVAAGLAEAGRELHDSGKSTVKKLTDADYTASCIHCGDTTNVQLWPHRNGHGQMVGFVFACAGCQKIVQGVWLEIHGIRGHETECAKS